MTLTPVLVAISLLFFTAAAFYRRAWGVGVVLIALPSYLIRFKLFGIPFTLLEAYILILFVAWLWSWLNTHRGIRSAWRAFLAQVPHPFLWLSLLWVAVGFAASFWSNDAVAGLGLWKAFILEPVLFALVFLTTLDKTEALRWLIRCLGLCVIIIGLVSLFQAIHLIPSPLPWAEQMPPRFSSVFEYPNAAGLLVAPIIALFIGLLTHPAGVTRGERAFRYATLFFGVFATGAAVSEGALLGLALAIGVLALLHKRRKLWIGLGALAIMATLLVPQARGYLVTAGSFRDTSGDVRLKLWTGTARLLQARPIEGAGLGGFPALYNVYRDPDHVELPLYPHNVVLNVWAEMGLAGLALFIIFIIRYFINVIRAYRSSDGFKRSLSLGLILAMITLLGHGLVDVPYFKNDLAALFFFLIMLAEVVIRNHKTQERLLPVVNEQDKIIGQASRAEIHKQGLLHREIHVYFHTPDGKIIFQRRAMTKDTFPGLLDAAVGGHVEAGETYAQAATKESEEETGQHIQFNDLRLIEKTKRKSHDPITNKINYAFRTIFSYCYTGEIEGLRIETNKASGFEAYTIDQLRRLSDSDRLKFIPTLLTPEWFRLYERIVGHSEK